MGTWESPAKTQSPSGAGRKFKNLLISLKVWRVVPESRIAEFFRGYGDELNAAWIIFLVAKKQAWSPV